MALRPLPPLTMVGFAVLALLAACPVAADRLATDPPNSNYTIDVYHVPTPDGVSLHTRVFTAHSLSGPAAVLFEQTPYTAGYLYDMMVNTWWAFVSQGNVTARLVLQYYRGTGESTGSFDGLASVHTDAGTTLQWLGQQPWYTGVFFRLGPSAMGMAAYMAAQAAPPAPLHGAFVWVATHDLYASLFPQGAYRAEMTRVILDFINKTDYESVFRSHEAPSAWWDRSKVTNYSTVTWPVVHMAGWYDPFLIQQLQAYEGFQSQSNPAVRNTNFLLVSPVGHCSTGGEIPWGTNASSVFIDANLLAIGLFRLFNDSLNPLKYATLLQTWRDVTAPIPRIVWYVMGPGAPYNTTGSFVTGADRWPDPAYTAFYLNPNGLLGTAPAADPFNQSYVFNPYDPVPTLGGSTFGVITPNFSCPCGPWDQLILGNRSDVVLYATDPLPQPVLITGAVRLVLHVASNATDTDFTAKLVDVYPNGTRLLILDSALRMRWRDGLAEPVNMTLGTVYRVDIALGFTSFMFPAGHRVGVDITSSNAPKYSVNPNTGRPIIEDGTGSPMLWARNTLHAGGRYDAQLVLPVLPSDALRPLPEHLIAGRLGLLGLRRALAELY